MRARGAGDSCRATMLFAGCVYRSPETEPYAPLGRDDLSAVQLRDMRLVGLPIHVTHGSSTREAIGRIQDEWQGADGSKYVSFSIDDKYSVFHEGVRNGLYRDLSLHHVIDPQRGFVPVEVSICHRGARDGTHILQSSMSVDDYKRNTTAPRLSSAAMQSNPPANANAMVTDADHAAAAAVPAMPAADMTPAFQAALDAIERLPKAQGDVIKQGWLETASMVTSNATRAQKAEETLRETKKQFTESNQHLVKQMMSTIRDTLLTQASEGAGLNQSEEEAVNGLERYATENTGSIAALAPAVHVMMSRLSRHARAQQQTDDGLERQLRGFARNPTGDVFTEPRAPTLSYSERLQQELFKRPRRE